jgi:transposase
MNKSIYPDRSQLVAECLARAGGPERVMVVAMDMAKEEHTALICLGTGRCLTSQPLSVQNTAAGAEWLVHRVQALMHTHRVRRENVLVGAEDPAEYAVNFIWRLGLDGFPFIRVNAREASWYRTNSRASSDAIDVHGIAQAILLQRGRALDEFDLVYAPLKLAARSRRRLVRQETAWKSRIHRGVDVLLPGFLDERHSGLAPFTQASLSLMQKDFSSVHLCRLRQDALERRLQRLHVRQAAEAATKLKALAERALPPPPDLVGYQSRSLAAKVRMLEMVQESIGMEQNEMARCLVQTPGFFLTTIPGVGVVLAAHVMAEYGAPQRWHTLDQMASYAGIVPRQAQSGGSGKPPVVGELPLDANRILKDYLLQAAYHAGTTGDGHRLQRHYLRLEQAGRHSRLSTAKLLLRLARAMVLTESPYLPAEILHRDPQTTPNHLIDYCRAQLTAVQTKWKGYDLSGIAPDANRLTRWKESTHELIAMLSKNV